MATYISTADGNFTATGSWAQIETGTGAVQSTTSQSTSALTGYVYSSAFTGTNNDVCDGILLHCIRVNTTGTITVALSADGGTTATRTVTVNASDLPLTAAWVFFKFSSSLTLNGGTNYKVGVIASSAGNATFYRDATAGNWARYLRLTAAASSLAAGDIFFIAGEYTAAATYNARSITMDSTATTQYGAVNICPQGTMAYGTSSATNYNLTLAGSLNVYENGTFNIGTSGTPIPRDSTAVLEFVCTTAAQYGLIVNGTFNSYGQSRTSGKDIYYCKLSANASASATSLTVDTDTGWLSGDTIALAPTSRTYTEYEDRTLNGNAGASSLTVSSGLTNARSGTSPTQAEIINLTRNVKIRSNASAAANATYVRTLSGSTVNMYWTELYYLGANTTNLYGIVVATTTGTFNMYYCSVHDMFYYMNISSTSGSNITTRYNVFYKIGTAPASQGVQIIATSGANTFSNNIIIASLGNLYSILVSDAGGYFDNNVIAGCANQLTLSEFAAIGSCSNNIAHSNGAYGFQISSVPSGTIDGLTVWRNNNNGIYFGTFGLGSLEIKNAICFGNNGYNMYCNTSLADITFTNASAYSEASYATTNGFGPSTNTIVNAKFINCEFSPAGKTAHTADILCASAYSNFELNNCLLGASTEVSTQGSMSANSKITSSKHDKTAGSYKTWKTGGTINRDITFYNTASPSERLTPISASVKLPSGSRLAAVDNSGTLTVSVYIRKSASGDGAAYNGNQPRLIVKRNDAMGITADTVLATYSSITGSWNQISGTTAAVTDDGVLEFYVDCDGTAGWINIDDWTVA